MSGMRVILIMLLAVAAMPAVENAQAHSPYFTKTEKIGLPDGTTGDIRLLHGDGIVMSNPVRAVILDAQGRAVARSHQTHAMAIRCDGSRQCKAYDLNGFTVSTPEPESFRSGGLVSGVQERWELEQGAESWGFVTKRMSLGELVAGHTAYLMDNKYPTFVPLLFTGFAVMLVLGVLRPAPSRRLYDRIVWYAIIVAAFCIAGLVLLMSLLMLIVSGLPVHLWFLLSAFAAVAVGWLFYLHRRKSASQA